ncbi:hypothetical protein PIB30_101941, partial [Stylosanthes scabra]|nr:hypothetical protein [Stylosanthes scabra]
GMIDGRNSSPTHRIETFTTTLALCIDGFLRQLLGRLAVGNGIMTSIKMRGDGGGVGLQGYRRLDRRLAVTKHS